jgi:hypothetical protein
MRALLLLALPLLGVRAQDSQKLPISPVVRVTLYLDTTSTAQFDARGFDLNTSLAGALTPAAELRLVKRAGAHTGVLLGLSLNGTRIPRAVIDVVDSSTAPAVTFRFSDVSVVSDHLSLSSARANLEQQRISQQEALSALTTDYQEAERQLATIEELNKTHSTTRADLARARDRASDLQRRIDLLKQRQTLLLRQADEQGPLDETIVLRFGRIEVESAAPGGRAAIDLVARPRNPQR